VGFGAVTAMVGWVIVLMAGQPCVAVADSFRQHQTLGACSAIAVAYSKRFAAVRSWLS
jgi:hypothetical protein